MEGEKDRARADGHKPQPRETDHCPLIPRIEGVAAKKSINSQAGGEERDEQPSRGRPPAWNVKEGGTVQREGALHPRPSRSGDSQPGRGHADTCAPGPMAVEGGGSSRAREGGGELSVSSLQRLVLSEVFL